MEGISMQEGLGSPNLATVMDWMPFLVSQTRAMNFTWHCWKARSTTSGCRAGCSAGLAGRWSARTGQPSRKRVIACLVNPSRPNRV